MKPRSVLHLLRRSYTACEKLLQLFDAIANQNNERSSPCLLLSSQSAIAFKDSAAIFHSHQAMETKVFLSQPCRVPEKVLRA